MAERRRLDVELVRLGLASSRTRAAAMVAAGAVLVDGVPARRPGTNVAEAVVTIAASSGAAMVSGAATMPDRSAAADPVTAVGGGAGGMSGAGTGSVEFASRAAAKLAGALAAWPHVPVAGARCLDAGASSGGFTDVLLRAGAGQVVAVDVGHGQLVPRLRADPRVHSLERCNVRTLQPSDIGGPVDLTVCDLSFISLTLVLAALIACTTPTGHLVVMVKPQFEVGRARLGRGGVVRDRQLRGAAVRTVAARAAQLGRPAGAVVASPLPGPAGNLEFFLWLHSDAVAVDDATIDRVVNVTSAGPA